VLPAQLHVSEVLAAALSASDAQVVVGARSGSKTARLSIANPLPPGRLAEPLGLTVLRVESLPPGVTETAGFGDAQLHLQRWRERLACEHADIEARYADGSAAVARRGRMRYLAGSPDVAGWSSVLARAAADAGLPTQHLDDGLRVSRIGGLAIACNFSDQALEWSPAGPATALLGERRLAPRGVSIWQLTHP
jgi:beta-galactosidase